MKNSINPIRPINVASLIAGAVLAAGALVSSAAGAGPVEDIVQDCMRNAAGTADSLERWSDHCEEAVREYELAYDDCMRSAAGTADSLERWVEHCAAEAAEAVEAV